LPGGAHKFSRLETATLGGVLLAAVALALFRLDTYPASWFDEGWFLQVPRNLALFGQYATLSAEGFRHDDTVLSVAPTLYAPIAILFKLVGVSLVPARLVVVAYLLAALLAAYLVARQLYGRAVGAAALYLLLFRMEADPFTSTLFLGRQVMGEVPALAFVLFGCLAWRPAVVRGRVGLSVAAGIMFGLAIVTKLQFVLQLPAALGVVAVLAWRAGRRLELSAAIVAAAVSMATLGGWFLCLWGILGTANARALLDNLVALSAPQVRVVSFTAIGQAMKFLLQSTFLLAGLPALLYALLQTWQERRPDPGRTLLLSVIITCLGWFVFVSVGWPRYAYPILALANILTAKLLIDLGDLTSPRAIVTARGAAAALMLLALPFGHVRTVAADLLAAPDHSVQELNRWIESRTPAGTRIETWELEVAFADTARRYHFPPVRLVGKMIAHVQLGVQEDLTYDFMQFQPQYLIIGRFAKWTALYPKGFLAHGCRKVATFGEYDVYEVAGPATAS